jgi:diguanylate cyclase (GGDEF)-like protein
VPWTWYFEPRDPVVAARWATVLVSLAAGVSTLFSVVAPPATGLGAQLMTYAVSALLIGAVIILRRAPERWLMCMWVPIPVAGVVAITALDLASNDASAAGQVFFCFPIIYSAALLRSRQALVCLTLSLTGEAIVVLTLQPFNAAITDLVYVGCTLITLSFLVVRAVDRQDELVEQLQRQAAVDTLTGLVTRRVLDEAAEEALSAGASDAGTALLLLDIDYFKSVNDTHGHPAGDLALQHVAAVLAENTRPDAVICRIGGDEIALLLPGCPATIALDRAEQLRAAISASPLSLPDGTVLTLSVSLGVGYVDPGDRRLRDLYASADLSLYDAKRSGRDRVGPVSTVTA